MAEVTGVTNVAPVLNNRSREAQPAETEDTVTVTKTVHVNKTWQRARRGLGAAGVLAAFLTAPSALADTAPAVDNTVALAAAEPPAAVPAAPVVPEGVAPAAVQQPPAAVPHLPSPDNLPPGTTTDAPSQGRMDYLRYLWNAVRSQDVTMGNAALLLAQRPMSANATPPAGVSTNPSGPVGTSAPANVVPVPSDTE